MPRRLAAAAADHHRRPEHAARAAAADRQAGGGDFPQRDGHEQCGRIQALAGARAKQRSERLATSRSRRKDTRLSVLSWKSAEIVLRPGRGPCRLSRKEKADGDGTTESGVGFERRRAANPGMLGAAAEEQSATGAEVANRIELWRRPHEPASGQRVAD